MSNENVIMGNPYLPSDNQIGPGPNGAPKGPPAGFKPLTAPSAEVARIAKSLLGNDFGTLIPFSIEGIKYMARLEPHYHPPGFKGGPNGWHKGVTVYQINDSIKEPNNKKVDRQKLYDRIDAFLNEFGDFT